MPLVDFVGQFQPDRPVVYRRVADHRFTKFAQHQPHADAFIEQHGEGLYRIKERIRDESTDAALQEYRDGVP